MAIRKAASQAGPRLEVDVRLPLDRFELRVRFLAGGGVTALFGPSGAGKSSVLEVVAGLRRGAVGRVMLDGRPWLDSDAGVALPPEKRSVGYVPQEGLLFPHLDVRGNLLSGASRARRAGREPNRELVAVAELLELGPLLDRAVGTLSGGERQRVALGRALCSGPDLLLLDEPLAALDLPLRRRLLPFLRRLRGELDIPMLLVSHDPVEVQALADQVLWIDQGQIVARGEPSRVLADPAIFELGEGDGGYKNVLPGRLVRRQEGVGVVALADGIELVAGHWDGEIGVDVLVEIPAGDILVATEKPEWLSARNVLPATIVEMRSVEPVVLVTAELPGDAGRLVAEVTASVPERLGLVPGRSVYLVIKAAACRIFG